MGINLTNFLSSQSKNTKMIDFQDLDHIDGISISVVSANLYKIIEMIYRCFISEKVQIMLRYIRSLKLFLKI